MPKSKLIVLLIALLPVLSTSCEKEEPYVNSIAFNGTAIYNVTSLLYNSANDEHIVYFSRFVDEGEISVSDYIYCIVGDALLGTDVDIMNSEEAFEWGIVVDGNSYFIDEDETDFFDSGSFNVDVSGENFYTVEADFLTFDNKSISIRWQGYFSYNVFYTK